MTSLYCRAPYIGSLACHYVEADNAPRSLLQGLRDKRQEVERDYDGVATATFADWVDARAQNPAAFGAACRERLGGVDAIKAGPRRLSS